MKNNDFSKTKDLKLIETILWENGGYFLLDRHMDRLGKSARFLSFSLDNGSVEKALVDTASSFSAAQKYICRLLLEKNGIFSLTSRPLDEVMENPVRAAVSEKRVDKSDVFYRHKTTNRALYESELQKYRKRGFFDVIFINRDEEVTEGAITNLIIKKNGEYLTPPLSCGLLPGTYREYLIDKGELHIKEKVLRVEDLRKAESVLLVNSVRKTLEARVSFQPVTS